MRFIKYRCALIFTLIITTSPTAYAKDSLESIANLLQGQEPVSAPTTTPTSIDTPTVTSDTKRKPPVQNQPVVVVEAQLEPEPQATDYSFDSAPVPESSFQQELPYTNDNSSYDKNTGVYMLGTFGSIDYPHTSMVRKNLAGGVGAGYAWPNQWFAEGLFSYSTHSIESGAGNYSFFNPYRSLSVDQIGVFASLNRRLPVPWPVRPSLGAVVGYFHRIYSVDRSSNIEMTDLPTRTFSDSLDLGFQAAVEMNVTNEFSAGFDFKYLYNIAYAAKYNGQFAQTFSNNRSTSLIERYNHYLVSFSGRYMF